MGCVLHGAVFLMVDASLPSLGKKAILEASKPCAVISWMEPIDAAWENLTISPFTVSLDENSILQIASIGEANERTSTQEFTCSSNTLYIMFTSGSTGVPKGVCASAAGTLNRFRWMWETFPFRDGDILCFKTSVLFVDSIWEIFGSVLKGVPLAIPSPDVARDPRLLSSFIRRHRVTRLAATPTLLQHLLELAGAAENLKALSLCCASGEPLSAALCTRFFNVLPSCRLLNLYGTTEICADVTAFEPTTEYLSKSTSHLVPIGKPISNVHIEIINVSTGAAVHQDKVSEEGELVVYGPCVADGYLDRNSQSSEEYSLGPKEKHTSFNTRDMVHYTSSGNLMYVGRRDHQIKLGGIKINPCEVEAILDLYPGVVKSAIVASESKSSLIGFVAVSQLFKVGQITISSLFKGISYFSSQVINTRLSGHLKQYLPKNCIPVQFFCSHTLPCLPSGKIDRRQLPSTYDIATLSLPPDTSPKQALSRTEKILTELIVQTLGLGGPSPNLSDDFVSMGGNSLSAIDLSVLVEKHFGYSVLIHDLLSGVAVKTLASAIDDWLLKTKIKTSDTATTNSEQHLGHVSPDQVFTRDASLPERDLNNESRLYEALYDPDEYPLLLTQHMMWLAQQNNEKEVIEIAALCLVAMDIDCLKQSIMELLFRHETLRTLIRENKRGVPYRHIISPSSAEYFKLCESVFSAQDCQSSSEHKDLPAFDGSCLRLLKFDFNLENGPLWRAMYFTNVRNRNHTCFVNILAFQFHHILVDGWCLKIILTELGDIYGHLVSGGDKDDLGCHQHEVTDMTSLAKDEHASLQDHAAVLKKLDYWLHQLEYSTAPRFLPAERTFRLSYIERRTTSIYRDLQLQWADIEAALKAFSVSEFVLTYAIFLLATYATTCSQDITVYLPLANRTSANAQIVGMVVETLPLRVKVHPKMTLRALLHSVKTASLELLENMHPYVLVDQWVKNHGKSYILQPMSGHYLQTMFVFHYDRTMFFSDSSTFREIPVCENSIACAITMHVHMNQSHEHLSVHTIYNTDWFDANVVNTFLKAWETAIPVVTSVNHQDKPIDDLSNQICRSVFINEFVTPNPTVGCVPTLTWAAGLKVPVGNASAVHICSFHMECIHRGLKGIIESHSVEEVYVLHPMSALLCAVTATVVSLKRDVYLVPLRDALHHCLLGRPRTCSVLVLVACCELSAIDEPLSMFHVTSTESLLYPSKGNLHIESTSLTEDNHHMGYGLPHSCSCQCVQLLTQHPVSLTHPALPTQHLCVRHHDVLTASHFLHTFQLSNQPAIFTSPLCSTFPVVISLLLEGIDFYLYSDTDVASADSLSDLVGIQESDLLIAPEILVPRLLQDLAETRSKKQLWIQGLPLGLAHVSKAAEKLFVKVLVTHSLLPDDVLVTHHFNLDTSTPPSPGTAWMPLGYAVCGINWRVVYPDGRQAIVGFPGHFSFQSANKKMVHSNAVVKQAVSGPRAGSFELVSLDYDAYYHGNDLTPLVTLLGQVPSVMWCHCSPEGVFFADCTNDKAAIVQHVLDHLQPSFVEHMYSTDYPPLMAPHFTVKGFQSPSSCNVVHIPAAVDERYQTVLDKLTDVVSHVFCIKPEEIKKHLYLFSISSYCMQNYFQLTLELNTIFKTSLTFKQVSMVSTMSELVALTLYNMSITLQELSSNSQ